MTSSKDPHRSVFTIGFITMTAIVIATLVTVASIILLVWPYSEFTQEILNESELTGGAEIETADGVAHEHTPEGYAILDGDFFTFDVETCNTGVDLSVQKWFDSYGKYSSTSPVRLEDNQRSGSLLAITQAFYVPEPVCVESALQVNIPEDLPRDVLYRFRVEYTYVANAFKNITVVTETEVFYLAPIEGEEDA